MLKGTKLYSILANKCPRCQEGDFFVTRNPYQLRKFDQMHEKCPCCHESYEREIGFYYGAMYVNYALTVAMAVGWFLIIYMIFGFEPLIYTISYTVLLVVLLPWTYRTGRLIWINFFVKYRKPEDRKTEKAGVGQTQKDTSSLKGQ